MLPPGQRVDLQAGTGITCREEINRALIEQMQGRDKKAEEIRDSVARELTGDIQCNQYIDGLEKDTARLVKIRERVLMGQFGG